MDQNNEKDFKDVLQDPALGEEIGADEAAVRAAGLTHPNEVELESILAEDWDSVPDLPEAEAFAEELTQAAQEPEVEAEPEENTDLAEEMAYEAETSATQRGTKEPEPEEEEEQAPTAEEVSLQDAPTQVLPSITQRLTPVEPDPVEETPVEEPEEEPRGEYVTTHVRKGRPKMKKGYGLLGIPHMISTVIWLAIIAVIGISLGRVLWVCCADVMSFGKPPVTAYITVTEEDDIESVSKKLADANLIRYPGLFQQFAEITKKSDLINTGTYELGSHLDYNAMINNMVYTSVGREEISITFPEGYNTAQTFRLLEKEGVCSVADLEDWAINGELDEYWFLEGIERTNKYWLEGYLAPDTYRFYTNDEPRNVLQKFLDAFDYRFTDRMIAKFVDLNKNLGLDLSIREVVTMASIVEKEKASSLEGYSIASVFYNRLTHAASYPYLNSDATLLYDVDYYTGRIMTEAEKSASPYNTYTQTGLPAGPIANPGLSSLDAALAPETTDYFFFIYDKNAGQHRFSRTLAEHAQPARELGYRWERSNC